MNTFSYVVNSLGWTFVGYYVAIVNHHLWEIRRRINGERKHSGR